MSGQIKRYFMQIPRGVDFDAIDSEHGLWVKIDDHTKAMAAKDEEIARLKAEFDDLFVGVIQRTRLYPNHVTPITILEDERKLIKQKLKERG